MRFQALVALIAIKCVLIHLSATYSPNRAQQCENKKKSFLWRVRRKGSPQAPAYLFGTIHVPFTQVWDDVPLIAKYHFQQAAVVYFELDLTDPHTITVMNQCQFLPRGARLNDTVPAPLYSRLRKYLEYVKSVMPQWLANADGDGDLADLDYKFDAQVHNVSRFNDQRAARTARISKARRDQANLVFNMLTQGWEQKRPIWIMLMLQALNENELRYRGIPVLDVHLAQEALQRNQKTGAIERVEEQCSPLNRMNLTQVIFALNLTLSHLEHLQKNRRTLDEETMQAWRNPTAQLVRHYNCGNVRELLNSKQLSKQLASELEDPERRRQMHEVDSYFEEEVIAKRNVRMAERVRNIMEYRPNTNFFFAFGAGHFVGQQSVVDLLREAGYVVEHVAADRMPDVVGIRRFEPKRRKRNQPARNVSTNAKNRKRTAPPPNMPVDPWVLSFVEPSERRPSRPTPAPRARPRSSGSGALQSVVNKRKSAHVVNAPKQPQNKKRATDEVLDYRSFWTNVLQSDVVTAANSPTARRLTTTPQQETSPSQQTTLQTPTANLLDLMNRMQQGRRNKLDSSKVIDLGEDQNESRRRRAQTHASSASARSYPLFWLSTCISIILLMLGA